MIYNYKKEKYVIIYKINIHIIPRIQNTKGSDLCGTYFEYRKITVHTKEC
nr:MAG TPA: hypothetical protein [Caudoviricetes sp.]